MKKNWFKEKKLESIQANIFFSRDLLWFWIQFLPLQVFSLFWFGSLSHLWNKMFSVGGYWLITYTSTEHHNVCMLHRAFTRITFSQKCFCFFVAFLYFLPKSRISWTAFLYILPEQSGDSQGSPNRLTGQVEEIMLMGLHRPNSPLELGN